LPFPPPFDATAFSPEDRHSRADNHCFSFLNAAWPIVEEEGMPGANHFPPTFEAIMARPLFLGAHKFLFHFLERVAFSFLLKDGASVPVHWREFAVRFAIWRTFFDNVASFSIEKDSFENTVAYQHPQNTV